MVRSSVSRDWWSDPPFPLGEIGVLSLTLLNEGRALSGCRVRVPLLCSAGILAGSNVQPAMVRFGLWGQRTLPPDEPDLPGRR